MRLQSYTKPNERAVPVPETTSVGVGPGIRSPNHDVTSTEFSTYYINPANPQMDSSEKSSRRNPASSQSGKNTPHPFIPPNTNAISEASSEKDESNHHYPDSHLVSKSVPKRGSRHRTSQPQATLADMGSTSSLRSTQTMKTWHVDGRHTKWDRLTSSFTYPRLFLNLHCQQFGTHTFKPIDNFVLKL